MVNKQQVWKEIIHPLATVLGAWGGFPKPPAIFRRLASSELFRYFLVFALVYQGGGGENIARSVMVTVGFYLAAKILDLRTLVGDLEQQAHYIQEVPAIVKPAVTAPKESIQVPPAAAEKFRGRW